MHLKLLCKSLTLPLAKEKESQQIKLKLNNKKVLKENLWRNGQELGENGFRENMKSGKAIVHKLSELRCNTPLRTLKTASVVNKGTQFKEQTI